ncbi:hypothetical protein LshimejAT787_0500490 [Lyophyllum shimeji]|uniref:Uncharacterized protein n=1 Tax=Lyophyllum shimeji TaxID=47721 RepID=A0A9P3UKJ6_LYOSH|nr:hypothetical protein LshimejAT787_0500490 [Lyophyllum shimeji]
MFSHVVLAIKFDFFSCIFALLVGHQAEIKMNSFVIDILTGSRFFWWIKVMYFRFWLAIESPMYFPPSSMKFHPEKLTRDRRMVTPAGQ